MNDSKSFCMQEVRGVVIGVVSSLLYAVIFSVIMRFFSPTVTAVAWINRGMKALIVFISCVFSIREEKGVLKGVLLGVLIIMLTSALFGAISGNGIKIFILIELLFGAIIGGIGGAVSVNLRR